jgi:hypothetical protein
MVLLFIEHYQYYFYGQPFGIFMALSASSLAPKALATSICTEKTVSTANLTFAKLSCCCYCSSFVKLIAILLVIAQIALATNQEGTVGGIDAAISWGVGTVTGIGAAALVAVLISNPREDYALQMHYEVIFITNLPIPFVLYFFFFYLFYFVLQITRLT